jgi:hypothetical protein
MVLQTTKTTLKKTRKTIKNKKLQKNQHTNQRRTQTPNPIMVWNIQPTTSRNNEKRKTKQTIKQITKK